VEVVAELGEPESANDDAKRAFGMSLAMAENRLVVSAPVMTVNGDRPAADGLVYTYSRNKTWCTKPKVLNPRKFFPKERYMPLFGYAVDLTKDGTRLVVTVPCIEPPVHMAWPTMPKSSTPTYGSAVSSSSHTEVCVPIAFVFIWNENENDWKLMYNVTAPDDALTTSFGATVSINPEAGDLFVAVGSPSENQNSSFVFLYHKEKPYAQIPSVQDAYAFGNSMTMYGDILAVGVPLQAIGEPATINGVAATTTSSSGITQKGGIVMYSISQLSEGMMTLVMTLTLVVFLIVVIVVLAIYKIHPSSIAAVRSHRG